MHNCFVIASTPPVGSISSSRVTDKDGILSLYIIYHQKSLSCYALLKSVTGNRSRSHQNVIRTGISVPWWKLMFSGHSDRKAKG